MTASNVPPGVSLSSSGGPEDPARRDWGGFMEWANDALSVLCVDDARRAVLIGCAAVVADSEEFERQVEREVVSRIDGFREDAIHAQEMAMEGGLQ